MMYVLISTSTTLSITAVALAGFGFAYFVLSTVVQGLLIAGSPERTRPPQKRVLWRPFIGRPQ